MSAAHGLAEGLGKNLGVGVVLFGAL